MASPAIPRLDVLAGVNGAGKSSVWGALVREHGGDYYNPDEIAKRLRAEHRAMEPAEANGLAWSIGRELLERAIAQRLDFAFETTLGGSTMTRLLADATSRGFEIYVQYVGLSSVELHLKRVRARVRRGGHPIPGDVIRRRYEHSRANLITLLSGLAGLRVFDNSLEADPAAGMPPRPTLALQTRRRKIVGPADLSKTPDWAKPIVAAALKLQTDEV